ncbi:MAG TPA: hypothetical protein VJY35_17070 [Candidatus Eisenbacteria bacterium]|nr:hypothetical protein [Candidatus Eisenbacteria bacterium]
MRRALIPALLALAMLPALAGTAAAAMQLSNVHGRMALGFSHVVSSDTSGTPGGSLSFGMGLNYPVASRLRAGLDVGYHLLGSRTLVQGTLSSGIDYSVFEALALVHWTPREGGLFTISAGPGLFVARAALAATSVGAAFASQAVEETRVGGALTVAAMRRGSAPVRVGLEAGVRFIPLESTTWTVASARIALAY